jgi:predicted HTH transcriptional regulator
MTDEDLRELIELGHETQGVEFKRSGPFADKDFRANVFKAMIAMANRRDGGRVILGVAEDDAKKLIVQGVPGEDERSWDFDSVALSLSTYADPNIVFTREVRIVDSRRLVVLTVDEFADVPVLCRREHIIPADHRDGRPEAVTVLRPGGCYVRSRRKPESTEIATLDDMRALIHLATEKGVQGFARLAKQAGMQLGSVAPAPEAASLYDRELKDLR